MDVACACGTCTACAACENDGEDQQMSDDQQSAFGNPDTDDEAEIPQPVEADEIERVVVATVHAATLAFQSFVKTSQAHMSTTKYVKLSVAMRDVYSHMFAIVGRVTNLAPSLRLRANAFQRKRAQMACKLWCASLGVCSPVNDQLEMMLLLTLVALTQAFADGCVPDEVEEDKVHVLENFLKATVVTPSTNDAADAAEVKLLTTEAVHAAIMHCCLLLVRKHYEETASIDRLERRRADSLDADALAQRKREAQVLRQTHDAEVNKMLRRLVLAESLNRRAAIIQGIVAQSERASRDCETEGGLLEVEPAELDETLSAIASAAEGEMGANALRDMILSFTLPRQVVGVRHTLMLTRESHQAARADFKELVQNAHSTAMYGSAFVWRDEHKQFSHTQKVAVLLVGFAMLTSAGGRDHVRLATAFDGLVALPFLIDRASRLDALYDDADAPASAHRMQNTFGANADPNEMTTHERNAAAVSAKHAQIDAEERERRRRLLQSQARVLKAMQCKLLLRDDEWVLVGHPALLACLTTCDRLDPAPWVTLHRGKDICHGLGSSLLLLLKRHSAVLGVQAAAS